MRFLNTKSLEVSDLLTPNRIPDYVILSHRWSSEEVTYADVCKTPLSHPESEARKKKGFSKIKGACELALQNGYEWIWIDSCSIDKSSSSELGEAINSMWRFYTDANVCYVYMADVPNAEAGWSQDFTNSEWFNRGWTLQELIAPLHVEFYASNWELIDTKFERYECIADITSIAPSVLVHDEAINQLSVAERLSWAAHRSVTKEEDTAYSLLGLFDINMPLLYGEGAKKAFCRLQEAIYNATADHSLFLFRRSAHRGRLPLLANSPVFFCPRDRCLSCPSQATRCLPSNILYTDIQPSNRWVTAAHEQIMITPLWDEASTVLPLLDYQVVAQSLQFFDDVRSRFDITHVAVLNHTLRNYTRGALCLLLRRFTGQDGCIRLEAVPAFLPSADNFMSSCQLTKVLVMAHQPELQSKSHVTTSFSIRSDTYSVEQWTTVQGSGQLQHGLGENHNVTFKIDAICSHLHCRLTGPKDVDLISISLVRMRGTWSIQEVYVREPGMGEQRKNLLFSSNILADRCTIELGDERRMNVRLQRLAGSARTPIEGVPEVRYQLSLQRASRSPIL